MADGASEQTSDAPAHRGLALWQAALVLCAFFLAQFVAALALLVLRNGLDIHAIKAALGSLGDVQLLLLVSGSATFLSVSLLVWLFARMRGLSLADFGLTGTKPRWFLIALMLMPLTYMVGFAAQWIFGEDFTKRSLQTSMGFVSANGGMTAATALVVIVLMPFAEELVFRATLFGALRKYMWPVPAMLAATLIFVVVHVQYTLAGGLFGLVATAQLALLSLVLIWLYVKSGSIWPSFMLHALNNAIAFGVAYAYFHYPQLVLPN